MSNRRDWRRTWAAFKVRLRYWMRPPRELKVTRFGWFFLLVTVGVGIAAINTENNLLYLVLGLLLGLIAASGLLSEMAVRQIDLDVRYPNDPVAGEPFLCQVTLVNRKRRLPSFAVQFEDKAGGDVVGKTFVFRIAAGETVVRAVEARWPRRGRLVLTAVRLSTRFPFGLFEKGLVADWEREVILLPRPAERLPALPLPASDRGHRPAGKAGPGAELYSLRPWQPADGVRKIHWKKSAGGAGLQSKVFEAEETPQVTLAMAPGGDEPLEEAVGQAARWVVEMENLGYAVGIVAGGRILPGQGAGHRLGLMRTLALYDGAAPGSLFGDEIVFRHGGA